MATLTGSEGLGETPSVLDDLGEEVTGIITPVSLCMAITVLLVRLLNPEGGKSSTSSIMIASVAYDEDVSAPALWSGSNLRWGFTGDP